MGSKNTWLLFVFLQIGLVSINSYGFDAGFKFHEQETQEAVVKEMHRNGIVYKIQADGSVSYFAKDEERVREIKMRVLHLTFTPSTHFYKQSLERRFLKELELAKIPYEVREKNGERWIYWSKEDDEKVKDINKKMSWPFIRFDSQNREIKFIEALKAENIKYEIIEEDDHRLITTPREESDRVGKILKSIPKDAVDQRRK